MSTPVKRGNVARLVTERSVLGTLSPALLAQLAMKLGQVSSHLASAFVLQDNGGSSTANRLARTAIL